MDKLRSLQVLRGIAALLVVYAHAFDLSQQVSSSMPFQALIRNLDNFGAVGVDIFFVISGVIAALSVAGLKQAGQAPIYLLKRALRICPYYWTVSLVALLALSDWFPVNRGKLLATFTFIPFWWGTVNEPIVDIGWTLCFEMFFYVCVAAFIVVRSLMAKRIAFGGAALLGLIAGALALEAARTFLSNPILIEFAMGLAIGLAYLNVSRLPKRICLWLAGAGATGLLTSLFSGFGNIDDIIFTLTGVSSASRDVVWGVPSALLVAGLLFLEGHFDFSGRATRILVRLGDASFSVYLVHPLLFAAVRRPMQGAKIPPDLVILGAVAFAAFVGWLAYVAVESPIAAGNRRIVTFATRRRRAEPAPTDRLAASGQEPSPSA